MIELRGTSRHGGIVMASAVVIDAISGQPDIPEKLLKQGIKALKMGLPEFEYPEVVIICDLLATGSSVRLPGIRTVGYASQDGGDPVFPLSVPCVSDISELLRSVQRDSLVIVDGNNGVVIIDPDVQTVVHYQEILEPPPAERVFLESAHLPAVTQDGRQITVICPVFSIEDAEQAISAGADNLLVDLHAVTNNELKKANLLLLEPEIDVIHTLLAIAAGKLLHIVLDDEPADRLGDLLRHHHDKTSIIYRKDDIRMEWMSQEEVKDAVCGGCDSVLVQPSEAAEIKNLIRTLPDNACEVINDD